MKKIRQLHSYLGVLFAPSIIFFALSGAFQTFRWQENGAAGAATPLLARMAAIHKDQTLGSEKKKRPPAKTATNAPESRREAAPEPDEEARRGPSPLPLKIYVFLMSFGLIASTVTGVVMAFQPRRNRRLMWILLICGTVLPPALLLI